MSRVIVFAGGGTAGHVEPALAVAREWMKAHPSDRCIFLGTREGLEATLVPAAGFELSLITKVRIPRKFSLALLKVPQSLMGALLESRTAINGASLLIGFGGYVSAPAYLAARVSGIPIVIHEANAKPGLANRMGALLTPYLGLAQPIGSSRFRTAEITGLPLREDVAAALKSAEGRWDQVRREARESLGFKVDKPLLFIFGGSQGSVAINATINSIQKYCDDKSIQMLHAVGKSNTLPTATKSYKPVSYVSDMATAYLAADLVIARSGAVTCSEVGALGRYALFVPLMIGNGEQRVNANELIAINRAEVINQEQFSSEWFTNNIDRLLAKSASSASAGSMKDLAASSNIVHLMEKALAPKKGADRR